MRATSVLRETKAIRPFLHTFKPEQGREYRYDFTKPLFETPATTTITREFTGPDDQMFSLTVSLNKTTAPWHHLFVSLTTSTRRRRPHFYEQMRLFLEEHLCKPIEAHPLKFEQIVQSLAYKE